MHLRSERGAVIIQMAVCLLGLMAFSALVVDYGILWSARGQAQNAADSGALAAAINLEFNPTDTTGAVAAAKAFAGATAVWDQLTGATDILVQTGLTCPPGSGGGPGCVRVDVLRGSTDRNGVAHGNNMPTFFARLVGVNSQAINATATAQVSSGNAVRCIKPWIMPDKWVDKDEAPINGWTQNDSFAPPDIYVKPGFTPQTDTGLQLVLKTGGTGIWSQGWAQEIDLGGTGSNDYRDEIEGCPSWVPTVAIYDGQVPCSSKSASADPAHGCVSVKPGVSQGPTSQGVDKLVAMDPSAYWDGTGVAGGCMASGNCTNPDGIPISPRIVPIAVFDTQAYYTETGGNACSGGNCVAQVTNLIGLFLEGMCDEVYPVPASRPTYCGTNADAKKAVVGRLMKYPGQMLNTGGTTTSTFAKAVRLVR